MTALAHPHPTAPAAAPPALLGVWRMVGLEACGRAGPPPAGVTWAVRAGGVDIRHAGVVRRPAGGGGFALVCPPAGGAGAVDFVVRAAGRPALTLGGGYTTDGRTLTLCLALRGDGPEDEGGPALVVYTFEREAAHPPAGGGPPDSRPE